MALGTDLRVLLGALAGVGLGGVALLTALPAFAPVLRPDPTPAPISSKVAATEVAATEVATIEEAIPAEAQAPRFDTVRVAPDGSGLVAGQASPGARVAIVAGEDVAAETTADPDGRFVAFLDLPASSEPRALSLRDEAGTVSEETVIVAPTAGPADLVPEDSGATVSAAGSIDAGTLAGSAAMVGGLPVASAPDRSETEMAMAETGNRGFAPDGAGVAEAETGAAPTSAVADPAAPVLTDGPAELSPPDGAIPGQEAVLLSDAEGVRVLQPALAPGADAETLATVALDAIGYGGEGEVLLTGRASGGGAVRLYLDNGRVADVPVGADGQWSATLPGTAPGDYTLRVDQVDAGGEVVSRIETPFRREARDDLAAAMAQAQQPGQTIAVRTVQPGNTLWAIARERYNEPMMYLRVFEANRDRIRDPNLIYPGQVFVLPTADTP